MRRRHRCVVLAVVSAGALTIGGCGAPTSATGTPAPSSVDSPGPLSGEITVLAAASLGDAFTALADGFEAAHPGVTVTLGLGPSSALAAQVAAGAPADVLATADTRTMDHALDGLATGSAPVVFARNTLALAVPARNPGDVDDVMDLTRSDVTFAVCAEEVPCGAAARRVLAAAGIDRSPVTFETDATAVLTKVVWDEVDAGLVYSSDVGPSSPAVLRGTVHAITIPADLNTTTSYPITALDPSTDLPGDDRSGDDQRGRDRHALAQAFVEHVLSQAGAQVLDDAGFLRP